MADEQPNSATPPDSAAVPPPAATTVPVSTTATAIVNPPEPETVTLYTRVSGLPVQVRPQDVAVAMAEGDLVEFQYDLDEAASEFFAAYDGARSLIDRMVSDARTNGYTAEAYENAANSAWGTVLSRWKTLTNALGALLPNEAQVAAWGEHRKAEGAIDLTRYPKLAWAKKHEAAIDAMEASHANG